MTNPERYIITHDCHGDIYESVMDQKGRWIFDPDRKIDVSNYSDIEIERKEGDVFGRTLVYDPTDIPVTDCSTPSVQREEYFMPDPKVLPWRSKEYRDHVRSYDCASCGKAGPSQFHHESLKNQGWGTKPPDFQGVPLCPVCHQLEECGQGMPKEDKLRAIVRCLGDWIQEVERIFKGLDVT